MVLINSFDQTLILNLKDRNDRKIEMLQKLSQIGLEAIFFDAVNGYNEPYRTYYQQYHETELGKQGAHPLEVAYQRKMIKSPGAWGYLETAKKILLQAKEKGHKRILWFDDDVLFHSDFPNQFQSFIESIPPDWKLIYLGASQHSWNFPKALHYPDLSKNFFDPKEPFYFPKMTDGSFAIGIDASVFDLLLEEISKMNCSFDSGPLRTVVQHYPEHCFVANPNLVIADVRNSDIQGKRDQIEIANKLNWDLDQFDFPFQKDLVSVIMPAYNAEETIEKAIRSILKQSYQELELLVVDDGSEDRTTEIVQQLSKEDARVRLVPLAENQGCYAARNAGLRASRGKVIAIQDADDISIAQRLEKQLIPLYTGEADFTIAHIRRSRCQIEELDLDHQAEMMKLVLSRRQKNEKGGYDYRDRPHLGFNSSVFKRELFEDYGLFWEERFGGDMEILERILYHKTGRTFTAKGPNPHTFLSQQAQVEGVYKRIDEVLIVSAEMSGDNLTHKHQRPERAAFEQTYRNRLLGKGDYVYPQFRPEEKLAERIPRLSFPTLEIEELQVYPPEEFPQQTEEISSSSAIDPKDFVHHFPAPKPRVAGTEVVMNLTKTDWLYVGLTGLLLLGGVIAKWLGWGWVQDLAWVSAFMMSFFALYHILRSQAKERAFSQRHDQAQLQGELRRLRKSQQEIREKLAKLEKDQNS
jgi:glycosyltransferase involved in cell wall biosynthesis